MTDDEMKRIVCRHMQGAFDRLGVTDDGGHTLRFFAEIEVIAARLAAPEAAAMREQARKILEDWFDAMQQVLNEKRHPSSSTTPPRERHETAFSHGLTRAAMWRRIKSIFRASR